MKITIRFFFFFLHSFGSRTRETFDGNSRGDRRHGEVGWNEYAITATVHTLGRYVCFFYFRTFVKEKQQFWVEKI